MSSANSAPDAAVVTFGCRLNACESAVIADLLRAAGRGEVVVVNTCAVTAEAERQARQAIRRLRRERPGAALIVTGCAAQLHPERFAAMPEVDRVLGNAEKLDPAAWRTDATERVAVGDIMTARDTAAHLLRGFDGHTRAFVEIQRGCDHRCTFCIIPFARGPSRSIAPEALVARVRELAGAGFREVVLTGVDIAAYGADRADGATLAALARRLLAGVPELERLRLSSLDPAEIGADLIGLFGEEPRLMPHLHLSLQSGDDLILKRMKRRHSRADACRVVGAMRRARPDIAIGADLIAGFPTESEAAFAGSLRLIGELDLAFVHVFPFSPRPGTPASRMPQVAGDVVRARAAALRASARRAAERFHRAQIGRTARVLVERSGRAGYSEHFAAVRLDGTAPPGTIVSTHIVGADAGGLIGRPAA